MDDLLAALGGHLPGPLEVEVLHAERAGGRDVATVRVLAGRLVPRLLLAGADGARWRVVLLASMQPEDGPDSRHAVALIRQRHDRLPRVGERLRAV